MGRLIIALFALAATCAVGEESKTGQPEIDLDQIYDQPHSLSPSQQYAFREYWARTFRNDLVDLPEYLDDAAVAELQSGTMPMTDNGVVALHWSGSQKGGHYVAVFDTNTINAPSVPIFSTNAGVFIELVQLKPLAPGIFLGRYEPGQYSYIRTSFGAVYIDADVGTMADGGVRKRTKQSWKVVTRWD